MKIKGRAKVDLIEPGKMSPDDRQTFQNDQYASGIIGSIHAQDAGAVGFPRPDPRDKMLPGLGGGQTYGEFDQMLAEEGWVNKATPDMKSRNYWTAFGGRQVDSFDHNDPVASDHAQFLLDTFKRAREVGYPIHPLMPYLTNQLPSTAFEGQTGIDHSKDQSMLDPWMFAANGIKVPGGGTRQSPAANTVDKTPATNLDIPANDYVNRANDNKKKIG